MMKIVYCEMSEGPRPNFTTLGIESAEGNTEYLTIEDRFLFKRKDGYVLGVRVVARDDEQGLFLVQLPVEADSGANRVWLSEEHVKDSKAPDQVTVA